MTFDCAVHVLHLQSQMSSNIPSAAGETESGVKRVLVLCEQSHKGSISYKLQYRKYVVTVVVLLWSALLCLESATRFLRRLVSFHLDKLVRIMHKRGVQGMDRQGSV